MNEPKYKVGDRVLLKSYNQCSAEGIYHTGIALNGYWTKLCGKWQTICEIDSSIEFKWPTYYFESCPNTAWEEREFNELLMKLKLL